MVIRIWYRSCLTSTSSLMKTLQYVDLVKTFSQSLTRLHDILPNPPASSSRSRTGFTLCIVGCYHLVDRYHSIHKNWSTHAPGQHAIEICYYDIQFIVWLLGPQVVIVARSMHGLGRNLMNAWRGELRVDTSMLWRWISTHEHTQDDCSGCRACIHTPLTYLL